MKTIIFGGAFDPPTKGHVAIFKKLIEWKAKQTEEFCIKVLVSCNDEKIYNSPFAARAAMVRRAFSDTENTENFDVIQQDARMLSTITDVLKIPTEDAYVVVGMDQAINIAKGQWHFSETLRNSTNFIIFERKNQSFKYLDTIWKGRTPIKLHFDTEDINTYNTAENILFMSSSAVRHYLSRDPFAVSDRLRFDDLGMMTGYSSDVVRVAIPKEVLKYINENGLYGQFDRKKYEAEEKKFIEEYKVTAKEKGWGEPSCTATILAMNDSEEILLVKRKGYPYKGFWALPGGFFELTDSCLEETASRELKEETSMEINKEGFLQIHTYSHMFDPRMRIIDTGFYIRVPDYIADMAMAADDAAELKWFPITDLPVMAFHHNTIVHDFLNSNLNPFRARN